MLVRPRVIDRIGGQPLPLARPVRVLDANVASELRQMLRGVVADGGTAKAAAIAGYDIAGKTGTANSPTRRRAATPTRATWPRFAAWSRRARRAC